MKRIFLFALFLVNIHMAQAYTVSHEIRQPNAQYDLAKFTICNEMSYPIFFIAWAQNLPDAYRWHDWIQPSECRTDKFDTYYDTALYEFSVGPYETPFKDRVLREGETYHISPFNQ